MYTSRSADVREIRVDVSRSVDGSRIRPTPEADDMICNSSGQHSQCSYYSNILTIWSSSILGPLLMGQWIFDIIWHFVHHTYFPSAGKKKHMRENTIIKPLHFLAHISAILCLVLFVLCLYCANCGLWANSCEHNYCVVDRAAHFPVSCLLFRILISAFQRALSSQALSEIKLFTILYSKTKGRGWCI